jgi:putative DNA primase/helicase
MSTHADPANLDAERAVIGALLLAGERIPEIVEILSAADFYDRRHQVLFDCLVGLSNRGLPIEFVSVGEALLAAGRFQAVGGNEYLLELAQGVTSAAHLHHHAGIVREHARRRRVIRAAESAAARAREARAGEELDGIVHELMDSIEAGGASASTTRRRIVTRSYAEVERSDLAWLWPGRFPLGKVSVLAGPPGNGKSLVTLDLAARVSRGSDLPDGAMAPLGSALLVSSEDDPSDTIRPRLEAAGADLSRVHELHVEHGWLSLRDDVSALEAKISELAEVRLVVLDPLAAFLGGADSYANADMRQLLGPLCELAARTGVALLAVSHLNKTRGGSALDRLNGSIAVGAVARAVWLAAPEPGDTGRRLFLPLKANLAEPAHGLAYRIVAEQGQPRIAWEPGAVTVTAEEALAALAKCGRGAADEAEEFLRDELADGPLAAADLRARADAAGQAWRTVQRAADDLGVGRRRHGFGKGSEWSLPSIRANGHHSRQDPVLGADGANGATGHVDASPASSDPDEDLIL